MDLSLYDIPLTTVCTIIMHFDISLVYLFTYLSIFQGQLGDVSKAHYGSLFKGGGGQEIW